MKSLLNKVYNENKNITFNKKFIIGIGIFLLFIILPTIFFFWGINPLTTAVAPGDGEQYGLPMKEFTKELRLWNPYLASGTSQLKEVGSQSLYLPSMIIMNLFPPYLGYNIVLLLHYFIAGYFTFLFLKILNLKQCACILGGIAFMFCGFLTGHKGHNTMISVATYIPVILFLIEKFIQTRKKKWLIICALSFALSITADYTASTMYLGIITAPYLAFRLIQVNKLRKKNIHKTVRELLQMYITIFIGGILLSSFYLFPIIESLSYLTRETISFDFFSGYSFPLYAIIMLIFPFFFGSYTGYPNTNVTYWGPWNATEMAGYMGILTLIIALSCIIVFWKKNSQIKFWGLLSFFSFLLVLGNSTPLYKIMYHIPIYNMFRVPARNWVEVNFAFTILFAFGINYLITLEKEHFNSYFSIIKKIFIHTLAIVFIVLFVLKAPIHVLINNSNSIAADGFEIISPFLESLIKGTNFDSAYIYIPIFLLLISGILILLLKKYRYDKYYWLGFSVVIFFDLFSFGHFHDFDYPNNHELKSDSIIQYLDSLNKDNLSYRILPLSTTTSLSPSRNLEFKYNTINSYGPLWSKDYVELTNFSASGEHNEIDNLIAQNNILSMLATKYLIVPDEKKEIFNNIANNYEAVNFELPSDLTANWYNHYATIQSKNKVILNSSVSGNYSLIQHATPISGNTIINISFDAKGKNLNDGLYIDLQDYDTNNNIDQVFISQEGFNNSFQHFNTSIYISSSFSNMANLRIFSYANSDLIIKNLNFEIQKIDSHSYIQRFEGSDGTAIFENVNCLPRTYFVSDIITNLNVKDQVNKLKHTDFDIGNVAMTAETLNQTKFETGQVLNQNYENENKVVLQVETGNNSFLVLTDSFYPGWKVFVDGQESVIHKVNVNQRGVNIQGKGTHIVEFKFVPFSFYIGILVSILTFMITIIIYYHKEILQRIKIIFKTDR